MIAHVLLWALGEGEHARAHLDEAARVIDEDRVRDVVVGWIVEAAVSRQPGKRAAGARLVAAVDAV